MKISIFISSLSGGGAERVVCNLANYLAMRCHNVELLTMGEAVPTETLVDGVGYRTLLAEKERGFALIDNGKRILRLGRYMKREKVDAYVVFLPRTTYLMLRLKWLTKTPVIASERSDPQKYKPITKKRMKKIASKADAFIFQTEETKAWYEPHLKGSVGRVIPNAINPAFIRPAYEGEREKVIVGAGRFNGQKNFPLLIRAFARIAEKFPEYKLVIYGQGGLLESYQSLAEELGIGDRVEFPGYVPDMPERLEKAGMFVLSSDYEGMPNALMEAMASGLPCVSTDCGGGGARFLIRDGENGLLVPIGDEVALADAMEKVLSDEALAATLGNNARKLQETLAPDKIYGEWEAFIKEIVEKSKRADI